LYSFLDKEFTTRWRPNCVKAETCSRLTKLHCTINKYSSCNRLLYLLLETCKSLTIVMMCILFSVYFGWRVNCGKVRGVSNTFKQYAQVTNETKFYRYLRQYTTNFCLTKLYFARGDMFRLLIQPSSGQLTIEQDPSMCAQYGIPHCIHIKYMSSFEWYVRLVMCSVNLC